MTGFEPVLSSPKLDVLTIILHPDLAKGGVEPPTTAYETDELPYSTSPHKYKILKGQKGN